MTRGDKLRAMTDKQLAHLIVDHYHVCPSGVINCAESCYRCWLNFLKEEVKKK